MAYKRRCPSGLGWTWSSANSSSSELSSRKAMALPGVEITITLDEHQGGGSDSTSQQPAAASTSAAAHAQPASKQPPTRQKSGSPSPSKVKPPQAQPSSRPGHLPFLNDIKSRRLAADSPGVRGTRGLPFLREIIGSRRRRASSASKATPTIEKSTEYLGTSENVGGTLPVGGATELGGSRDDLRDEIKSGQLQKTSRGRKADSKPGPTRLRRFRLTEEALEYYQQFSHVKIKRSYPLTSIEDVKYNEKEPTIFDIIFSTYVMTLEADTADEAKDWVKAINDAWSKWHLQLTSEGVSPPEGGLQVEQGQDTATLEIRTPTPVDDDRPQLNEQIKNLPDKKPKSSSRQRSYSANPGMLRRESTEVEFETYDIRRNRISNQAFRFGHFARLRPRLEKAMPVIGRDAEISATIKMLHDDSAMIKYPRQLLGIPQERLFKLDNDNLQILWRRNLGSKFRQSNALSLHKIVEVREGQKTKQFDKFPYEEVESQSFSLIFEEENKKYVRLSSLDFICDHPTNYSIWMKGLNSLVAGPQWCSIYPTQYKDTDPTILWLKQLWSCKSCQRELPEKDAIKMAQKFNTSLTREQAKIYVIDAHQHQFRHTFNTGYSLRWDGFLLLYNLICGPTTSRLFTVFRKYAKTYPKLGLTEEEFRNLLINECEWKPRDCRPSVLQALIQKHDFHHRAFKKYVAGNKPFEYQMANKLFSYAGFISFLRSQDNSAIDPEHETVYQDMTQPLSHYFINSSHNTYLEGDQLNGKSSTDAYVRAFLQGCRCVEIDCWDDTLNVTNLDAREPIIYHGFTLTTKLPFRDVIHAIKDYGFTSSIYPVIISIENHCNKSQQSRMARIFRAIFGEMLPDRVELMEVDGKERLPSPQELQGKIILKGSYKGDDGKTGTAKKAQKVRQKQLPTSSITSVSSASSTPTHSVSTTPAHSHHGVNGGSDATDGHTPAHSSNKNSKSNDAKQFSRSRSLREIRRRVYETEHGQDDQELAYQETVGDLKSLIIYAKSTSIKPWKWEKQKATSVTQMFSFGEPTAVQLCTKFQRDMLACTERQLVRTYPKGTRFDSSNYDPMLMWRCGVQMVSLNFQYPDIFMHLNQGMFRLNGGCGYVLKPALMRVEDPGGAMGGSAPFSPELQVQHPDVPAVNFEIELISGQRLCPWKKKCSTVTVEIHTYGITHDCTKMEPASHSNVFWPQWKAGAHRIEKKILMPEMCLVYFRVEVDGKKLYGQNCIPLISLQPGTKFIPMRTTGGELIPESGVFVKISKVEVEEVQTSLRGGKLHKQSGLTYDDETNALQLSTIREGDEELEISEDVDVLQSINPLHFQRRPKSPANPLRPVSSPPLLESTPSTSEHRVEDSNQVVVTVDIELGAEEHRRDEAAAKGPSPPRESQSLVKPRSLVIEESSLEAREDGSPTLSVEEDGVKEYHLKVRPQLSQDQAK